MNTNLDQPAFPGGQVQTMEAEGGKKIMLPNYSGFTKREVLHVLGALAIYANDDKLMSLRDASLKYGKTLEELMIDSVHSFVQTVELSISKGEENARQENDDYRPSPE